MAGYISDDTRKVTTHRLVEMKQRGEKISMLTAYDYTMAQIVDGAGMDVILVGDSASNVMAGNVTTLPITLDQMIYHAKSVVRGVKRAMVVVDMPFGSYQGNEMEGLASAIRIMKESHADALKLEGGEEIIDTVKRIISAGIPVMGHLGLMPQSINKYGTYTVRAKDDAEADKLIRDAHLLCSHVFYSTEKEKKYRSDGIPFPVQLSYRSFLSMHGWQKNKAFRNNSSTNSIRCPSQQELTAANLQSSTVVHLQKAFRDCDNDVKSHLLRLANPHVPY